MKMYCQDNNLRPAELEDIFSTAPERYCIFYFFCKIDVVSCPLIICNHLLSTFFFFSCHLSYRTNQHVRSIFNQLKLQPYHLLSSHMSFQLFAVDLNFFVTLTLGFSTSARGRNLHIKMLQRKLHWVGFQLMLFCQRYLSLSLCVRE